MRNEQAQYGASAAGGLHPSAQAMIERAAAANEQPLHLLSPREARAIADARVVNAPLRAEQMAEVRDLVIERPTGPLKLRLYKPVHASNLPFAMFFHGGGFMVGSLETHDALCRALAARSGAAVIAVDFRLAPEHPFPAASDDCFVATDWVLAHADELSIDRTRYAVAGESSGGNLAAGVAIRMRESPLGQPRLQLLLYPFVDASLDYESYRKFGDGFLLTTERSRFYVDQYLQGHDPTDPLVSPLQDPQLEQSPPTFILTAGFDPTRDPALAYARRLAQAGVEVETVDFPGWTHGFLFWGDEEGSLAAIESAARALTGALRN